MRRVMTVLAAAAILYAVFTASYVAWAQRAPTPGSAMGQPGEAATKYERFVLKKGTIVVREFYRLDSLGDGSRGGDWTVLRAYSPGDQSAALALRIEAAEYGSSRTRRTGLLDADEVMSLRAALPRMHQMLQALPKDAPYTEVEYRGGSVRVGWFGPERPSFFVQLGHYSDDVLFVQPDRFDQLNELVQKAATKIDELSKRRP